MKTAAFDLARDTNQEGDLEKLKSFLKHFEFHNFSLQDCCVVTLPKSLCNEDEQGIDISDLFSDYELVFLWKSTPQGI